MTNQEKILEETVHRPRPGGGGHTSFPDLSPLNVETGSTPLFVVNGMLRYWSYVTAYNHFTQHRLLLFTNVESVSKTEYNLTFNLNEEISRKMRKLVENSFRRGVFTY